MGAHAYLPPSGAKAWRACPMWPTMNDIYPKADTPESLEGTAAHWVFEQMLGDLHVAEGDQAPNGVYVTDEILQGAELFVDTFRARGLGKADYIEHAVPIPRIHDQCWGTPDVFEYFPSTGVLEILDYKFGHRFVDEYENDQCVAYALGILDAFGLDDQSTRVNITIVQPRCFYKGSPVRTWSVLASDLRAQANILANAAAVALAPNPQAVTNPECIHCPGRRACPALQKAAYSDAEFAVTSPPVELSPEAASLELRIMERALSRLEARVSGMREVVTGYAKQGQHVPFHRVEQGYGRKQWSVPVDQVLALGTVMGVDLSKPGIVTPKQAVKIGIDEAVISSYSVTPLGQLKLVADNPADARRVFGTTYQEK